MTKPRKKNKADRKPMDQSNPQNNVQRGPIWWILHRTNHDPGRPSTIASFRLIQAASLLVGVSGLERGRERGREGGMTDRMR